MYADTFKTNNVRPITTTVKQLRNAGGREFFLPTILPASQKSVFSM